MAWVALLVLSFVSCPTLFGRSDDDEDNSGAPSDGSEEVEGEDDPRDATDSGLLDIDGDGLSDEEERRYNTNPSMIDTDGDGFSDFEEVVTYNFNPEVPYRFNPLVADVPKLEIAISNYPEIELSYTTTDGVEESYSTSESFDVTTSGTTSYTDSVSRSVEETHTTGVSTEAGYSTTDGYGVSVTGSYEYSHATTNQSSYSYSESQTEEMHNGYEETRGNVSSSSMSTEGGRLAVTASLTNTGNVAFAIESLMLSAYTVNYYDPTELAPIASLSLDGQSFPLPTMPPNGQNNTLEDVIFSTDSLTVDTTLELLRSAGSLQLRTVGYELTDADGSSYFHEIQEVQTKCAAIIVDFGPGRGEQKRYLVATNLYDENRSITAEEAMEVLEIPYELSSGGLVTVDGVGTNEATGSYWKVLYGDGRQLDIYAAQDDSYQFNDFTLIGGSVLQLVYISDPDGDGLGAREEAIYRTDPRNDDSDGDGLSDGEEIYGWDLELSGSARRVHSDPMSPDTDGDGKSDREEQIDGTNPNPPIELTRLTADADNDLRTITVQWDQLDPTDYPGLLLLRQKGRPVVAVPEDGESYAQGDRLGTSTEEQAEVAAVLGAAAGASADGSFPAELVDTGPESQDSPDSFSIDEWGTTYHYTMYLLAQNGSYLYAGSTTAVTGSAPLADVRDLVALEDQPNHDSVKFQFTSPPSPPCDKIVVLRSKSVGAIDTIDLVNGTSYEVGYTIEEADGLVAVAAEIAPRTDLTSWTDTGAADGVERPLPWETYYYRFVSATESLVYTSGVTASASPKDAYVTTETTLTDIHVVDGTEGGDEEIRIDAWFAPLPGSWVKILRGYEFFSRWTGPDKPSEWDLGSEEYEVDAPLDDYRTLLVPGQRFQFRAFVYENDGGEEHAYDDGDDNLGEIALPDFTFAYDSLPWGFQCGSDRGDPTRPITKEMEFQGSDAEVRLTFEFRFDMDYDGR